MAIIYGKLAFNKADLLYNISHFFTGFLEIVKFSPLVPPLVPMFHPLEPPLVPMFHPLEPVPVPLFHLLEPHLYLYSTLWRH